MEVGGIRTGAPPVVPVEQPLSQREVTERRQLVRAVQKVNEARLYGDGELTFSFDRESRRTVLRIVHRDTREVIQQIPTERVLRLAADLD